MLIFLTLTLATVAFCQPDPCEQCQKNAQMLFDFLNSPDEVQAAKDILKSAVSCKLGDDYLRF